MSIPEKTLSELSAKYPRGIIKITGRPDAKGSPRFECVFRTPTNLEYKRYKAMVKTPTSASEANEYLSKTCVIFPEKEEFILLIEDFPGLPDSFCADQRLFDLLGLRTEEDAGKI